MRFQLALPYVDHEVVSLMPIRSERASMSAFATLGPPEDNSSIKNGLISTRIHVESKSMGYTHLY